MVRTDVNVESIGKMAILQDTWSPLKIGAEGDFDGGHFFLVGRVQYRWTQGNWSEWYATFNDGRTGWMTEAQGFYGMTFPVQDGACPPLSQMKTGTPVIINKIRYTAQDIKEVGIEYSEGELPFRALAGRKSTSVDLVGGESCKGGPSFASIEYSDEGTLVFAGHYQDFELFHFQNLREIDGW